MTSPGRSHRSGTKMSDHIPAEPWTRPLLLLLLRMVVTLTGQHNNNGTTNTEIHTTSGTNITNATLSAKQFRLVWIFEV